MVCEWMNEWMNECSRSKCCCNCSQSQNVNSLLLRVPLQPFGFSQQTAIRGITVGSQILWTAEFRILRFCDSPFRYRRFDNSLLRYHMATKLASPPLVPLFTVHVTLGSARFSLLDKWGCLLFFVSRNETLLRSFISFHASRKCLCLIKKDNFRAFLSFFRFRYFLILIYPKFLESDGHFTLKIYSWTLRLYRTELPYWYEILRLSHYFWHDSILS